MVGYHLLAEMRENPLVTHRDRGEGGVLSSNGGGRVSRGKVSVGGLKSNKKRNEYEEIRPRDKGGEESRQTTIPRTIQE